MLRIIQQSGPRLIPSVKNHCVVDRIRRIFGMKFFVAAMLLISHAAGAAQDGFKVISVVELSKLMTKKPIFIYDANTDRTRRAQGLIPGAFPLENSSEYDVKKTLPADKKSPLVFYCHSTT